MNLYGLHINRKNLCSSARQCGSPRDASVSVCGSAHGSVGAVRVAAVCGSVLGTSVWQCARQCGSVRQCATLCGSVRQCAAV
jgi:hypothetical protein